MSSMVPEVNGGASMLPPLPPWQPLRAARVAPAGFPPDVAPGQIVAASHINAIRDSVALWPGHINANGKNLIGAGVVDIVARNDGTIPFVVRKADTSAAWLIAQTGELSSNTSAGITTGGPCAALGGFTAGGAVQLASAGLKFGAYRTITWAATDVSTDVVAATLSCNPVGYVVGGPRFMVDTPTATAGAVISVRDSTLSTAPFQVDIAGNVTAQGAVVARTLQARTTATTWPLVVLNEAGNNQDWLINAAGDFGSNTGRAITTAGAVTAGGNSLSSFGVNLVAASQVLWGGDVSLTRPYAGALMVNGPTAGRGNLHASSIEALGTISTQAAGVSQATLYPDGTIRGRTVQVLRASDDARVATMQADGAIIGTSYYAAAAGAAGPMVIDAAGSYVGGGVFTAGQVVAHGGIVALDAAFNTDQPYKIHGLSGAGGSFTTADGKTITVTGGIITAIV